MNRVLEQLPKAAYWSMVLTVLYGIFILLALLGFGVKNGVLGSTGADTVSSLLKIVIYALWVWFFLAYRGACKRALQTEAVEDIEQACRWQKRLMVLQGFFSLLILLALLLVLIGISVSSFTAY